MRRALAWVLAALLALGAAGHAFASSAFPVTIEHKYGRTTIPAEPKRIVAVGYNEQDFVIALGVIPVGVREWLGGYPFQTRPWAKDALQGQALPTVGGLELDIERIASLRPDLILGMYAGLSQEEYTLLSRIAPTIVQPAQYPDWGIPWRVQTIETGRALGRLEQAQALVAKVDELYAEARAANPEFEGMTAAFVSFGPGEFWIFEPDDVRTQFLTSLGFKLPAETGGFSRERANLLDVDVLVAVSRPGDLENDPLYGRLNVVREGRVIYLDGWTDDLAAAIGFNSPISLEYLIERIVPLIEKAVSKD